MHQFLYSSLARARARKQRERFEQLERRAQLEMLRAHLHQMVR